MFKYKAVLVTGGAGFIGSHFVKYLLKKYKGIKVVNVDVLSYCANPENVREVARDRRYKFYKADIGDQWRMSQIMKKHRIDCVVNFAAESNNNKALISPIDFAKTNALGTAVLLEAARKNNVKRFHHISTCEVYGQLPLKSKAKFREDSPLLPRTPYNASKAAAEHIVRSYYHTFGLPITISNCGNNYGPNQFPENIIPVFAIKALLDQHLPMFASKHNKREWIYVTDHCRAIDLILQKGKAGETYNVGTGLEKSIIEIADEILKILKKPKSLKKVVPDRAGHDTRYLLDSTKIKRELGWKPKMAWQKGIRKTIEWYHDNPKWWKPLLEKSYAWK